MVMEGVNERKRNVCLLKYRSVIEASALSQQQYTVPLLTVHRTVNKARRAIIVSGVPPSRSPT